MMWDGYQFLKDAMNSKIMGKLGAPAANPAAVSGQMNIPNPVVVNANGDMDMDTYKKCSMIMSVCVNMVQKQVTDAAQEAGVAPADALKNIDAWVAGFVDFPLPVFNFKDTQSNVYKKNDFTLNADAAVVENIVNIKNVQGLKDSVISALKKSGGNLASYSNTDQDFKYFGIITGYASTEISIRAVSFAMHMKETVVKSLCGGAEKTTLNSSYDTYQFVADRDMMVKLSDKMGDKLIDVFADMLYKFIAAFYEDQLKEYKEKLNNIFKR
ncbi:MAG: hypothetical protein ABFC84_03055 [Veillonellales bacterium]